ncbi:RNA methyltransferase [Subsaximicrobium wynnwilliamsii]|uniref:tRNA (guanosine(18)-2'-O)-methyltransferase n=1 Tax=Subsaximicrobium wynnwilliamsii TaxID=291179 RepID=A0A5C6ZJB9_9FLAO|nr:RNA methyltransferase [Subsaximicrobium wynnwilliamsii]TXD83317.1 RNA methyltransferase [Subsaximicrobium wynnwilliamsii]TXD89147.1 RNA methyltransferase [Subsaximicrobium wynnwilliamsii]TXE03341.1 RNA methyltransferase [Subsaximicrobium wynnwilliamsii]
MIDIALLEHLEGFLTTSRIERFKRIIAQRTRHFCVATEDVFQLHNTSAVMRSCDVFGVQDVHIVEEQNAKQIDSEIAMGSQKWVDVYRYQSVKDSLNHLKGEGYQIVATTPHENDSNLQDFDVSKKSCFFFGRETEGLSKEVIAEADAFLKIPMYGFTESLNISVSAAVILQHLTARLRESDVKWQLTEAQQLEKRLDWCRKTIKSNEAIEARFYKA